MARRANKLKSVRQNRADALLLELGGFLAPAEKHPDLKAWATLKALNMMDYQAITADLQDLDAIQTVLGRGEVELEFPVVLSNLKNTDDARDFCTPYLIEEVNGLRVGILGIAMPENSKTKPSGLTLGDPVEAVKEFLPEIQAKSDVLILLSRGDHELSSRMYERFPEIDIVIGREFDKKMYPRGQGRAFVRATNKARSLGWLQLAYDRAKGEIVSIEVSQILLDDAMENDLEIQRMLHTEYHPRVSRRNIEKRNNMEQRELLKMSPEEAVKFLNKQSPE
ncbi:MAG: hypothetical protein K9J81_11795 [Desulfohalobiaceae bacterium]|nr:hypothetical protein [Desulfohalobiaceae bacterium]